MTKAQRLILIGDTAFAQVAYEYFTHDSPYEVVAFSVERTYLTKDSLFGVPVVPFEELSARFAPESHAFFVATTYAQMNGLRARLYQEAKSKGFAPASYISSRAFVWSNCQVGEHCFIFENNVVQPFVRIGNNVVLWSGNHIGHHSVVEDHCFLSSHVVVSGYVHIGQSCFLGVNATIANNLTIGHHCLIGAGSLVIGDLGDHQKATGLWRKKLAEGRSVGSDMESCNEVGETRASVSA